MTVLTDLVASLRRPVEEGETTEVIDIGRRLLSAFADDPSSITANLHPLGFVHAKLLAIAHGMTFRLHLWPAPPIPPQDPAWHVHRHVWPLRSYVLFGAVTNSDYRVLPDENGDRQLYEIEYEGTVSQMRATGEGVTCERVSEETYLAGTTYAVPVEAFHSTRGSASVPSATLAIAATEGRGKPLVVGGADGSPAYEYERRDISELQLSRILEGILTS